MPIFKSPAAVLSSLLHWVYPFLLSIYFFFPPISVLTDQGLDPPPQFRLQGLTIVVPFCPTSYGSSPLVDFMYPVLSIYQIKALAKNRIL